MILAHDLVVAGQRHPPLPHLRGERGAGLDGEGVGRHMRDARREVNGRGRKARQAVDKVDGDVVEAGGDGVLDGVEGLAGRVAPVEEPQHAVVEALHADAQAVEEVQAGKTAQIVRRQVLGVGLDGGLLHVRHVEPPPQALHDAGQLGQRQQRRGAAAEVNGLYLMALLAAATLHLAKQAVNIKAHGMPPGSGPRVEGAVGALAVAERYVYVNHASNWSAAAYGLILLSRMSFLRASMRSSMPGVL